MTRGSNGGSDTSGHGSGSGDVSGVGAVNIQSGGSGGGDDDENSDSCGNKDINDCCEH